MSSTTLPPIPARIGPAEISRVGSWIAIRCPRDLAPLMRQAGGLWEPGSRRWLVERHRLGPLVRALRRDTDPLFRQAGLDLDSSYDREVHKGGAVGQQRSGAADYRGTGGSLPAHR